MRARQNPWRYSAPPGWNDIQSAPKDGTVIEIQNNWGVAPTFLICRWSTDGPFEPRWRDVNGSGGGPSDGPHLSWRPYNGSVEAYTDPTGGAQNTQAYWLHAVGRPDLAIKAGNRKLSDPIPQPEEAPVERPRSFKPDCFYGEVTPTRAKANLDGWVVIAIIGAALAILVTIFL